MQNISSSILIHNYYFLSNLHHSFLFPSLLKDKVIFFFNIAVNTFSDLQSISMYIVYLTYEWVLWKKNMMFLMAYLIYAIFRSSFQVGINLICDVFLAKIVFFMNRALNFNVTRWPLFNKNYCVIVMHVDLSIFIKFT